jgi:hypothetical protein
MKPEFYQRGSGKMLKYQILMKILPVELLHADGRMDIHDEANSRFS